MHPTTRPRPRLCRRLIRPSNHSNYGTASKLAQDVQGTRQRHNEVQNPSNSSNSEEVKPWMVTFTPPKQSAASIRFGNIPPASKQARMTPKADLPLSWRSNNEKRLQDFRRASAAVQRSLDYKLRKNNQGSNPVGLKGWASLVEERIESARQQGHFGNLRGRGKPLLLSDEERNPFISREEFFMNRIIKKNNAAPPWVELHTGVDTSLSSFRQILVSTWVRHAVRKLCVLNPVLSAETRPEEITSFRDRQWEIRENSFQAIALEEVNSAIRNYNHVAPYTVRKAFIDLSSELERAYQDAQPLIEKEIARRKAAECKNLLKLNVGRDQPVRMTARRIRDSGSPDSLWEQLRRWISRRFGGSL